MPFYRAQPYRLFFPSGVLMAWLGVGQWLGFALGSDGQYRVVFHAMVQVQGFLALFISGFLFTFIPKRTQTGPPATWQVLTCAVSPWLLAFCAWQGFWPLSQVFWLLQLVVLLQFLVGRARSSRSTSPMPRSLVWVPLAFALGLAGSALSPVPSLHALGKMWVLEGLPTALVLGIGAMLLPIVTRGEPPVAKGRFAPQVLLALVFAASFVLQAFAVGPPWLPWLLRAAVSCSVLVYGAKLWRAPTLPGLNRRIVWLAAWFVPLGQLLLALRPELRTLGLHVIYLGGFSLLSLGVAQHVLVAHSNAPERLSQWPTPTAVMALLMGVALLARLAMQLDPLRLKLWMTAAVVSFLAAGAAWLWAMAPFLRGTRAISAGPDAPAHPLRAGA